MRAINSRRRPGPARKGRRRVGRDRLLLEILEGRTLLDGQGWHPPGWDTEPDGGEDGPGWLEMDAVEERLAYPGQGAGLIQGSPPGGAALDAVNDPSADTTSQDSQSETTLLAFPSGGGTTLVSGFNDSGSFVGGAAQFTGFARSTDGGNTFVDQGGLPLSANGDAGDPVLARDNTSGTIYFATLQFYGSGINVFRSFDDGATFTAPTEGAPGKDGFQDKPWITVDNAAGPGQGNVYLINRDFGSGNGIYLYRSTDGGASFGPTGGTEIASGNSGNVQGAWVTVAPDHSVDAFWFDETAFPERIMMSKSTDQGLTFGAPVTVAILNTGTAGLYNGDMSLTGVREGMATSDYFRSNAFPQVVVNPTNGDLYAVFDDKPASADRADVYFTMSSDGGATWSPKTRVNDDATMNDQWQPTIAVTPDGSKLGIFWYDRRLDPANNLIDYYGTVGDISGHTVSFQPNIRITDHSFLPEFGRDPVLNPTYMGDYDVAAADNGNFYVTWADTSNDSLADPTRKNPDIHFARVALGLTVASSTPADGNILFSKPTQFVINLSDAYDPSSVQASDLVVNGVPASSVALTDADTLTFSYATSPVTSQGVQSMSMADGSVLRLSDGNPLRAFTAHFRYDATLLQVSSTSPADGSAATLPLARLRVTFNEAYDPASLTASDLVTNVGTVTGVNDVNATTVDFLLSGLTQEGTLTASLAAGSVTDVYGNPGAAFSGSYALDFGTVAFPAPLGPKPPAGSLIYDPTQSGTIGTAGDTDSFSLLVDPGQKITVTVNPSSTLRPAVDLYRVGSTGPVLIATASAGSAGLEAVLQSIATTGQLGGIGPGPATYIATVRGVGGSTGAYTVQMILNAAVENENHDGASDNTRATAQSLEPAFLPLNSAVNSSPSTPGPAQGSVLGRTEFAVSTVFDANFEGGADGFTVDNTSPDPFYLPGLWHLSTGRGAQPGHSANQSFYYGHGEGPDGGGSINVGSFNPTSGGITSPAIALPSNGTLLLDFNYVLQTRGFPSFVDFATLQINNGGGWNTLQEYDRVAESSSWRTSDPVDLTAFAGQTVQLRWSFDTRQGPVGRSPEGWYVDDVRIRQFTATPDYYSFNLRAGDSVTLGLKGLSVGSVNLALENAAGTTLAIGNQDASNLDGAISNFVATTTGTYYARVAGTNLDGTDYSLVVTRNAAFNTEPNDSIGTAQDLISSQVSGQRWAVGNVTGSPDLFALPGTPISGPLILASDKITLGIADDGSYIVGATGIQFLGNEFVSEGSPLAGFTIGFDGENFTNKGALGNTDIAVTKFDLSSGNLHGVRIVGTIGGVLELERVVVFKDGDEFATVETRLTNLGGAALSNVAWLENLDPDQGEPTTGDFGTLNDVVLGGRMVRASAATPAFPQGLTIGLGSSDSRSVVSAAGFDNRDPFQIINNPIDPNGAYGDIAINLAFNYGNLAPSGSVSSIMVMAFGRSPAQTDATYLANAAGTSEQDHDFYRVTVDAQKTLEVQTATPADQGGEFVNNLDPMIRLYDSAGNLVASNDNGAADRRNADLTYKVPKGAGGTYYIEVLPSTATAQPTRGEYILSVKQTNGTLPAFQVTTTDPADGTRLRVAPTAITVNFNDNVLLTTLQASDLTIDGVPASGLTVVDGDTAVFALPGSIAEGTHVIRIAAGAIQDLQNTPILAYNGSFVLDLTPPRIVDISLQQGDVAPVGDLTYTVQFSEPMRTANLDDSDFSLFGSIRGVFYAPVSASYDPSGTTLTLQYAGLPEDNYTLTLFSGDGAFEDVVGWDLDGEPTAFPIPPNQTGNGVEGGNFLVNFSLDVGTAPYPTPTVAKPPPGSLIYDPSASGLINTVGDTDNFTLNVDPGQTITVVADPGAIPLYGGVGNGSFDAGSLLLVNSSTGSGSFVGDPVTPGGLSGLAFDPSAGVLYGSTIRSVGNVSTLVKIDPATGALLATIGTITDGPGGPGISIGDLALQPGTNTLFGIRSGGDGAGLGGLLYTIDKTTGVATFIGNTDAGAGGGIAFAPDGSLYQTAFNNFFDFPSLNKLNPADASRISTVSLPGYFDGLAIRPSDGVFFAATGGSDDSIYTINPATGAITFLGETFLGSTSDLAFGMPALTPTLEIRDPSGTIVALAGAAPGQSAVLQTVPVPTGGTYTITVGGAAGTSGQYTVRAILNAAVEDESYGGPSNDTPAGAQDLGPTFIDLVSGATRGAVLGRTDAGGDLFSFHLDVGQSVSAVARAIDGGIGSVHLALLDSGGNVVANGLPASPLVNGSFETGDFGGWTTAVTGSPFVDWTVSPAGSGSGFFPGTSPQDGTFDAWNGFDGAGPMQYTMSQDVTIPAGAPLAQFSWDERIQWNFALTGTATQPRTYEVEVLDPVSNSVLATLYSFSTGIDHIVGDTGWQTHTADLSAFAGSTVRLLFQEDIPETFTGPGQIEFDAIKLNVGGPTNVDDSISNFVAPAAGTYYIKVTGTPNTDYSVVVTPDAVFDLEDNNTLATAQPFGPVHVALGSVGLPGDPADVYSFTATAGQTIHLFTSTPGDGPGEFNNTLDPHLRLFDALGTLLAEGVPTADGRNEDIRFTTTSAGTYYVEVTAEGGTSGEYILDPSSIDDAPSLAAPSSVANGPAMAIADPGHVATIGGAVTVDPRTMVGAAPVAPALPSSRVVAASPAPSGTGGDAGVSITMIGLPPGDLIARGVAGTEGSSPAILSGTIPAPLPNVVSGGPSPASTVTFWGRSGGSARPAGRSSGRGGRSGGLVAPGLDWLDQGAAPAATLASPADGLVEGLVLDDPSWLQALDACLGDSGWADGSSEPGRHALAGLAMSAATILAAWGLASKGRQESRPTDGRTDNDRPRPRVRPHRA